jgi:hypothetical protein
MKNNLKDQIRDLLIGKKTKQDVLVVSAADEPGFYNYRDNLIDEAALDELKKDFHNTVIFVRTKKDLTGGANVFNVTSVENAEKLKDFLIN